MQWWSARLYSEKIGFPLDVCISQTFMHELGHNLGLGHGDGGTIANVAGYKGFWYNPDAWMTVNFRMHRIKYIYLCELLDPPEKDKRQYYIEDQLYWTDFDDIYDELPEGKSGGE